MGVALLTVFAVAFVVSLVGTALVRRLAPCCGRGRPPCSARWPGR